MENPLSSRMRGIPFSGSRRQVGARSGESRTVSVPAEPRPKKRFATPLPRGRSSGLDPCQFSGTARGSGTLLGLGRGRRREFLARRRPLVKLTEARRADDLLLVQFRNLLGAVSQLTQHLVAVLAQERRAFDLGLEGRGLHRAADGPLRAPPLVRDLPPPPVFLE